ncbi:glutaredoxin family protein [Candidatus Pacearchaeota archaeon]|nr:glutaredoxin family protein [Candidatus Pacearchaeota archaeon]
MITIYTTPTCPWCRTTKEFLKSRKIKYKEIDVSKDRKAAEEMIKKSGQYGVPVLDINGKIVIGFDKEKIEQLIK